MINSITSFFLEMPLVGSLIYRILSYLDKRSDKRAYTVLLAAKTKTVQVLQKNLLNEAIGRLKRGLKANLDVADLKDGTINNVEIHQYATGDKAKLAETLIKAYVYNGTDIKTEGDKARVAIKRIEHYKEKQNHVLQTQLIRSIRKESDPIKKAELMERFRLQIKEKK